MKATIHGLQIGRVTLSPVSPLGPVRVFPMPPVKFVRAADVAPDPYPRTARVATIIKIVAAHFSLSDAELLQKSRKQFVVWPKHLAMAITCEVLGMKPAEVERHFGFAHASANNALRCLQDRLETQPASMALYEHLRARCQKAAGYPNDQLP
jgi:hypothetical protein